MLIIFIFLKYREIVKLSSNFKSRILMILSVSLQNLLMAARKSFDVFFLRYPYCYGYWKKYADLEKKHGNIQVAEEVTFSDIFH